MYFVTISSKVQTYQKLPCSNQQPVDQEEAINKLNMKTLIRVCRLVSILVSLICLPFGTFFHGKAQLIMILGQDLLSACLDMGRHYKLLSNTKHWDSHDLANHVYQDKTAPLLCWKYLVL